MQPQVLIPSAPQVVQPAIQPSAPVMVQPQQFSACYFYPINQCPRQCNGGCSWPRQYGCLPTQQWPFFRCGYGGPYFGGNGGIGGYGGYGSFGPYIGHGGYGGLGGNIGQNGYGGYNAGAQPIVG